MNLLPQNLERVRRLVHQAIETFELTLVDTRVLTEAATGNYSLTPVIAAVAGAEKVYAMTRDSRYARADQVIEATKHLARFFEVEERIEFITNRQDERIGIADVVTNLGFVRPLDAKFLHGLNSKAAIALMWETWEFRPEDIDLSECRRLQIPLLGTDEHQPELDTFGYVGQIALKLLFELGIEVMQSKVAVLGSGVFAQYIVRSLESAGAKVVSISRSQAMESSNIHSKLNHCDALVLTEHPGRELILSNNGLISPALLSQLNPGIVLVHIAGGVEVAELEQSKVPFAPAHIAPAGYMSVATDYVGPKPLIDLHTAGLRVGAELRRARLRGLSGFEAEVAVLKSLRFAQGFEGYHPQP